MQCPSSAISLFSGNAKNSPKSPFLAVALMLLSATLAAQTVRPGLEVRQIAPDFYVYTTYQTFNGLPTPANSMYVVTEKGIVMIDVPWDTTQTIPLLNYMEKKHGKKAIICIATHFHEDRTGALNILERQGIKTFSSLQTLQLCKEHHKPQAEFSFRGDTTFRVGRYSFEVYYPGAGHTKDNIVIWFPKEKILYGGCFVKSVEDKGLGNLSDADLAAWPASLKRVMQRFKDPAIVIPGHDGWQPGALQHTMELLKKQKGK